MSRLTRPRSLSELFGKIRKGAEFVAGGTDWVIAHHGRNSDEAAIIDLSLLEELRGIEETENYIKIGALETMTELHSSPVIRRYFAALADAAYIMGSEQIRNRATVGGNAANASPAADTPVSLAALDAKARVVSACGERMLKIEELIGRGKNNLAEGEVIKEFIIPKEMSRISAFLKVGSRTQMSISRVNLAVSARPCDGLFKDARVYIGTLGTAVNRCREAEEVMARRGYGTELPKTLAAFAAEVIPGRPTLPYKQSALRALAADMCARLEARAGDVLNEV